MIQYQGRQMKYVQPIVEFYRNYANFRGRTSRATFWYTLLWAFVPSYAALLIDNLIWHRNFGPLYSVYLLATLIPGFALYFRRIHDSGRSAWHLLWYFTIIGMIPVLYWVGFKPGTKGPNQFGDDPLTGASSGQPYSQTLVVGTSVTSSPPGEPPAAPTHSSPAGSADLLDRLEQLARLRQQGILTDEEFAEQKRIILGS